ncbi:hypothetical protein ABMA28_007058 [Loxostege sticticalis]|uniref:Uncharacterized protein n=1 Tax=Loxostege sticticalis TaxID=481309 RepID=A0ABD0TPV4_LOXSC
MDVKTSRISYPKSVISWYLKLFCKRRKSDKNKMLEGIQSWLTLSKSEKQQFFNKYKECRLNHKVKLANYLSKVQPYLKKKVVKRASTNNQIRTEEIKVASQKEIANDLEECNSHLHIDNDDIPDYIDHPMLTDDNPDEAHGLQNDHLDNDVIPNPMLTDDHPDGTHGLQNTSSTRTKEKSIPVLAEPAPPSVRTGKELFEMLKATSTDMSNESWATLSNQQKMRYQQAIRLLKNDYIRKYKAYLESLPPKELFNCYNNFFD